MPVLTPAGIGDDVLEKKQDSAVKHIVQQLGEVNAHHDAPEYKKNIFSQG